MTAMHSSVASWEETASAAPHARVSYHESVSKLQASHGQALDRFATGPFDRLSWYRLLDQHGLKETSGEPLFALAEGTVMFDRKGRRINVVTAN